MIIDMHTHAWPDKVAERAREHLESLFQHKMVGMPTLNTLDKFMLKNHIDTSVICAVATKPQQVPSINDWLFGIKSRRYRVFCSMHPDYPQWENELNRIRVNGDGVKLQPEFQGFYADDQKAFPMYQVMEELEIPVLFHCGEELSGTMLVRSSGKRIINIKKAFPKLKIIAAHFGGFKLWEEAEKYLVGEDIYLDTSFFFGFLPDQKVRDLLFSHRPDRLLFGTDFPLVDQAQDLEYLARLGLPQILHERILYKNAENLLGS
ncbi:MAG: amidohydrolase family protein [Candidatus Omnitrophica bacterium]|jgi:hypothetical protein|nr:amidohydrolase family protein [Candidatus Omnitrophota bacterium]